MNPGPPPMPLERRRSLGNPSRRPLPKPRDTFAVERLAANPPRGLGLGDTGRRMWTHVAALPWVAASDAPSLEVTCQLADLLAELRADIAEYGLTYESRGRHFARPSVAQAAEANKQLWSMLGSFGLSPADRTRLGIAEVRAQSKFDRLLERREARGAERDPAE